MKRRGLCSIASRTDCFTDADDIYRVPLSGGGASRIRRCSQCGHHLDFADQRTFDLACHSYARSCWSAASLSVAGLPAPLPTAASVFVNQTAPLNLSATVRAAFAGESFRESSTFGTHGPLCARTNLLHKMCGSCFHAELSEFQSLNRRFEVRARAGVTLLPWWTSCCGQC